ncbi:unnamed protein product [Vicia faba]|uniref:Uncharacterized protein n=1 Tax=Vicia faba TaxID=3906 RepID=A0AAV0YZA1_VICFA|nr:unnamed protein product [Vicia faba]
MSFGCHLYVKMFDDCHANFMMYAAKSGVAVVSQRKYVLDIFEETNELRCFLQRKYALDIIEETDMLHCKTFESLIDPNVELLIGQEGPFTHLRRYQRLVGLGSDGEPPLTFTRKGLSVGSTVACLTFTVRCFLHSRCLDIVMGIVSCRVNWKQLIVMETIDIFFNYFRRFFKNIFSHAEQISQAMIASLLCLSVVILAALMSEYYLVH